MVTDARAVANWSNDSAAITRRRCGTPGWRRSRRSTRSSRDARDRLRLRLGAGLPARAVGGDRRRATPTAFRDEAALARASSASTPTFVDDVPFVGGPGRALRRSGAVPPAQVSRRPGARRSSARGGRIYEHSDGRGVLRRAARAVKANGHTVTCDDIVLATHKPLVGVTGMAERDAVPDQARALHQLRRRRPGRKGRVPDALFWDTADPYHYLRARAASRPRRRDLRRRGSQDRAGDRHRRVLRRGSRRALRGAGAARSSVTHRWSGQVIETPDGLPYIGETAEHQFAATGFAGNGMTFGTLGAMMAPTRSSGRDESVDRAVRSRPQGDRAAARGTTSRRTRTIRTTWSAIASPAPKARSLRAVQARAGQDHRSQRREGRRLSRRRAGVSRCGRRSARTWDAWSAGTRPSGPGTARATARASSRRRGDRRSGRIAAAAGRTMSVA